MKHKWEQNPAVRNAGWLISGKMAQMLLNLVAGLWTARYLGPSNYGLIHYAAAYTALFSSLCSLGIPSILVKELTDAPEAEGEILGTSLLLRGIAGGVCAITILCTAAIADRDDPTVVAVVGLSSVGMFFQMFDIFCCWFQSRLQSRVTAAASLLAHGVTTVYKIALLMRGESVAWFALATSVEQLSAGVFLLIAYRTHQGSALRVSLRRGKQLLKKSCHFILPGMMVAIYTQTDKIMLKQMVGQTETGYYSIAVSLSSVWCFVLTAIIDSMYPGITQSSKTDEATFCRRNKQLYAAVFYLSVSAAALLTCLTKPVLLLMYGESYLPAAAPLRIISWYTAFSYLGVARNAWIVCKNRQKYLILVYISAAVSNVLLNDLLIPFWGATGAAVASLISQVITVMAAPFLIKGLRENAKLMLEAILLKDVFGG